MNKWLAQFREKGSLWMFVGVAAIGMIMAFFGMQQGIILSAAGIMGLIVPIITGFIIGIIIELIDKSPDKPKILIRTGWIVATAFLLERLLAPIMNQFM